MVSGRGRDLLLVLPERVDTDDGRELLGHLPEGESGAGLGIVHHHGAAVIASLAHADVEGYLAQEGGAELPPPPPAATVAENLDPLAAVRAAEAGHVLDD